MKIKLLLILYLTVNYLTLFPQVKGTYFEIIDINSDVTCYLTLYDTKDYKIELNCNATDDIVESILISFGTYKRINNYYQLEDKFNGSITELVINDKYLEVHKGLEGFLNKKFILKNQINDNGISNLRPSLSFLDQKSFVKSFSEINYGNFINDFGVQLNISSNMSYMMHFQNFTISKGNIVKRNSKICFYDPSIKYYFNLYSEDSSIYSSILPYKNKFYLFKKEDKR